MGDTLPKARVAAVQAAPVFLDREATVEKALSLIDEAARNGADLIAFPEVFISGYPYWNRLENVFKTTPYFAELLKNAVEVPSPATDRLCKAAQRAGAYIAMGINERPTNTLGTLYNTNLIIDPTGDILLRHRKLMPTYAEKLVWGFGDGSTLRVLDTPIGKLGTLICGENANPLRIRPAGDVQDLQPVRNQVDIVPCHCHIQRDLLAIKSSHLGRRFWICQVEDIHPISGGDIKVAGIL